MRAFKRKEAYRSPNADIKTDRYIFSEKVIDRDKKEDIESSEYDNLYQQSYQEYATPQDRSKMSERMFVDEIYRYMDDPRTIELGLDYRNLIQETAERIK